VGDRKRKALSLRRWHHNTITAQVVMAAASTRNTSFSAFGDLAGICSTVGLLSCKPLFSQIRW
jgi:hypothetical protein